MTSSVVILTLTGCDFFRTSDFDIQELPSDTALVTGADRRIILSFANPIGGAGNLYCIEPSPDAAANISRTLESLLKANVAVPEGPTVGGEGSANLANSITIEQLFDRSQGVQNIRDILFSACVSYANGFLTQPQYAAIVQASITSTTALIAAEIAAKNGLNSVGDQENQRLALNEFYQFIIGGTFPARPAETPAAGGAR